MNRAGKSELDRTMLAMGYVRVRIAAEAAGVSVWTAYKWANDEKVAEKRGPGRTRYLKLADVLKLFVNIPTPDKLRDRKSVV